ncbi:MAG: hypothetical protein SFY92_06095 [Verrucomicrobiae bacterium]|nr:hypothetical protein [Verrucomicrobiae bacterium]
MSEKHNPLVLGLYAGALICCGLLSLLMPDLRLLALTGLGFGLFFLYCSFALASKGETFMPTVIAGLVVCMLSFSLRLIMTWYGSLVLPDVSRARPALLILGSMLAVTLISSCLIIFSKKSTHSATPTP